MKKSFSSLIVSALIVLSVSVLSNVSSSMAAFGTSPPWVRNNQLLPGSTFRQVIYLSRDETSQTMQVHTKVSGDENLLAWMTIPDQENLIMEKGQNIFPMTVIVSVPEDVELKNYTGSIFITLAPLADTPLGGGQVAVALGAHIAVDITVITDEVTDYRIKSVSVDPMEEEDPFAINMKIENTGNIAVSRLEGQIDIYNAANSSMIKSLDFAPLENPVAFNEINEIAMVYEDYKLQPGQYWVEVTTTKDGKTVYQNRLLQEVAGEAVTVVTPEDAIGMPAETQKTQTAEEKNNIYFILGVIGWIIGLLGLGGILVLSAYHKKTKHHRRKPRRGH